MACMSGCRSDQMTENKLYCHLYTVLTVEGQTKNQTEMFPKLLHVGLSNYLKVTNCGRTPVNGLNQQEIHACKSSPEKFRQQAEQNPEVQAVLLFPDSQETTDPTVILELMKTWKAYLQFNER
ncbi:hypothetical protein NL676_015733 [Syzygium grande]|nr:hypothetical protein NL676_015733 [Syzygium grande]